MKKLFEWFEVLTLLTLIILTWFYFVKGTNQKEQIKEMEKYIQELENECINAKRNEIHFQYKVEQYASRYSLNSKVGI